MRKINSVDRLLICWQLLSCSVLIAIVSLTILEITKIKLPEIKDKDIIAWLVEIN